MNCQAISIEEGQKSGFSRVLAVFTETFGFGRGAALATLVLISLVAILAGFWFSHSAPPHTIIMTSGPTGSGFETNAMKYRKLLARNGVTLKILPSEGSLENLHRLETPSFHVDIAFVQSGVSNGLNTNRLVSLGSIAYQPLLVFYRSAAPIELLSELKGKRLSIGPPGSGTRSLALTLLETNGIAAGGATTLVDLEPEEVAKALLEGRIDSAFLMGDSASSQIMRQLLRAPEIHLFDFTQADGYVRRIRNLNKLVLPKGSIDFGKNIPSHDVSLIGPTVELLARHDLHPALSDLLLEAAQEIHGGASLFQRRSEFPAPLEHDFPISSDAARYYKSGKGFLYRYLPFWVASLVNRILAVVLPVIFVLIPGLRIIPSAYRWRIRLRIYRWYRALLVLEKELFTDVRSQKSQELLVRLDHIETEVNKMKVPASFADQFYGLRGHIGFVRDRLLASTKSH
jgi:NMT1-like family